MKNRRYLKEIAAFLFGGKENKKGVFAPILLQSGGQKSSWFGFVPNFAG